MLDLHWSTVYDRSLRRSFGTDDESLVARAVRADIAGSWIPVLDAEDQLLHLCMHACLAGGHRLGWLQDIRMAVLRAAISWPVFWARAEDQGLDLVAAVVLDRTGRCFGLDVPVPGGDSAWLGVVHALDRVRPPWHLVGGQGSGRFVVGATRADAVSSVKALGGGLAASLLELRDPAHPWRTAVSIRLRRPPPTGLPNVFAQPGGGERARAAYLRGWPRARLAQNSPRGKWVLSAGAPAVTIPVMTTPKSTKKAYESPRVEVSGKVGDLTLANKFVTQFDGVYTTAPDGTQAGLGSN